VGLALSIDYRRSARTPGKGGGEARPRLCLSSHAAPPAVREVHGARLHQPSAVRSHRSEQGRGARTPGYARMGAGCSGRRGAAAAGASTVDGNGDEERRDWLRRGGAYPARVRSSAGGAGLLAHDDVGWDGEVLPCARSHGHGCSITLLQCGHRRRFCGSHREEVVGEKSREEVK
jgi:hypothetical protein